MVFIGLVLFIIGVLILPIAVRDLKLELKELKKNTKFTRRKVFFVEILDYFSLNNYLTWLLSVSCLLMIIGVIILFFSVGFI